MNDKSKAPNFLGLIDENNQISLSDYKGSFLVLYFYPKDKTSGCTIQSQDFRDYKKKFANKNCKIIGISRDSIKSQYDKLQDDTIPLQSFLYKFDSRWFYSYK